ncbi:class I SAM-dependent methyltransferase [Luteolibacter algae]|uniref:Class I SAM-dependent methyltransferase n=1 Tax=Luteolibacter algae TaxID=454151 RepID=A0ABW5DAG6_9BACT
MFPPRPTQLLHLLLKSQLNEDDVVIDATAGNGHDTLFLAQAVGPRGRVIAVDIQEQAIRSTESRLQDAGFINNVDLYVMSHSRLSELVTASSVACIMFNLGYLPGADHHLITTEAETLKALSSSLVLLKPGGILTVVCYPGHPGGETEALSVKTFLEQQSNLRTASYGMIGTKAPSPFFLISKKMTEL